MRDLTPSSLQSLVPPSQQCEQAGEASTWQCDRMGQVWLGRGRCSDTAQEQLAGRTAWRRCSPLLVLQQLSTSSSHTVPVAFFLPQTSV